MVFLLGLITICWGAPLLGCGMFNLGLNWETVELVGGITGWTPIGRAWALPADLTAGRSGLMVLRFALALVLLAVVIWVWSR